MPLDSEERHETAGNSRDGPPTLVDGISQLGTTIESSRGVRADPPPASANSGVGEIALAANNVSRWREYLPEACVKAMIEMGWDVTT
jgi:hypothetical protein